MKVTVEIEIPEKREVRLDPRTVAVVVVDLQNEGCDPAGRRFRPASREALENTARLVARCRAAGGRTLWVQSVRRPDAIEFTHFGREPHLIEGTWAVEFTPPLQVAPGDPVIRKYSHDCFNCTGFDDILATEGISAPRWSVLVTGVGLPACVNHAVLGFSVRDFHVYLPLDCVAPRDTPAAYAAMARYAAPGCAYNTAVTDSALIEFGLG